MSSMWADIRAEVYGHPGQENRADRVIMDRTLLGVRRNAHRRAVQGFVKATGTQERWHTDAAYHAALEAIAGAMVAAIFDETLLTPEEARERVKFLQTVAEGVAPEVRF